MVREAIVVLLITGFFLVGCSQADPTPTTVAEASAVPPTATVSQVEEIVEATPEIQVIDSTEELAGTWLFASNHFRRYFEDGTIASGDTLIQLDMRTDAGEFLPAEYRIEDGLFHTTDDLCAEAEGVSEAGVYQIQRVDNERIRFVEIDDPCWYRRTRLFRTTATMRRLDED